MDSLLAATADGGQGNQASDSALFQVEWNYYSLFYSSVYYIYTLI